MNKTIEKSFKTFLFLAPFILYYNACSLYSTYLYRIGDFSSIVSKNILHILLVNLGLIAFLLFVSLLYSWLKKKEYDLATISYKESKKALYIVIPVMSLFIILEIIFLPNDFIKWGVLSFHIFLGIFIVLGHRWARYVLAYLFLFGSNYGFFKFLFEFFSDYSISHIVASIISLLVLLFSFYLLISKRMRSYSHYRRNLKNN